MLWITRVTGIVASTSLGRGLQISDRGFWLTNDPDVIRRLISPRLASFMGYADYTSFLSGGVAIYAKSDANPMSVMGAERFVLHGLGMSHEFLMALWLLRDNAGNCESGFLECDLPGEGMSLFKNDIALRFSRAFRKQPGLGVFRSFENKETTEITSFTESELKEGRSLYQNNLEPIVEYGMRDLSERESVARSQTIAAKALPKLLRAHWFVTTARAAIDLGVKVASYITCLETLFVNSEVELRYRLAERVAWVVGRTGEERVRAFKNIKRAYDIRSKMIHGDVLKASAQADLNTVSESLDEITRSVFRRVFTDDEVGMILKLSEEDLEKYFTDRVLGAL